mgnify:CR=1 FL=1
MTPDDATRFRLTLHYDGSSFLGWQLQPNGRTVQGELEAALKQLTGKRRVVTASGRTDRGVHALGQVVAVSLPSRWGSSELHRALNAVLPPDLWLESVRRANSDFHPRFDALARSYEYRVGLTPTSRSPFHQRWCWPLVRPLELDLLQRGAALLLGDHSFRAFAKTGQEERGDRCTVTEAQWRPWSTLGLVFHVTANRFLHHMVRYLVGTLVDIGRERRPLDELVQLLTDPETELETSPPAPPEGLFLARVDYPEPGITLD